MAQRGRPRLLPTIPPSKIEARVAEKLVEECGTLGCKPAFHLDLAKEIVELVRNDIQREKIN